MGLFDGISLKGVVRDVTNVVGAFTGAQPIQQPSTMPAPAPGRPYETNSQFEQFLEYLPPIVTGKQRL